jgi:HEAT repeat protein
MKPEKGLGQALESWQQGRASLEEVRALAADVGNEHYTQGIPGLVQLLDHDDEIVRYNAVNSLAFEFHHKPVAEKLLAMLAGDPDDDCRRVAAGGLGALFQNSRDRRILAALGYSALNDPEEYVRSSAYKSLQIVNGVSPDQHLELLRSQSLSVDPARVESILTEISG